MTYSGGVSRGGRSSVRTYGSVPPVAVVPIEDRRSGLEEYLQQHDSIIDTEIDGVNHAVDEYSATLDRYFEELSQSEDPSTIVARAEALPAPPDLDQVRAQARSRAVAAFGGESR